MHMGHGMIGVSRSVATKSGARGAAGKAAAGGGCGGEG